MDQRLADGDIEGVGVDFSTTYLDIGCSQAGHEGRVGDAGLKRASIEVEGVGKSRASSGGPCVDLANSKYSTIQVGSTRAAGVGCSGPETQTGIGTCSRKSSGGADRDSARIHLSAVDGERATR